MPRKISSSARATAATTATATTPKSHQVSPRSFSMKSRYTGSGGKWIPTHEVMISSGGIRQSVAAITARPATARGRSSWNCARKGMPSRWQRMRKGITTPATALRMIPTPTQAVARS